LSSIEARFALYAPPVFFGRTVVYHAEIGVRAGVSTPISA
jgi:hypothetical protein